MFHFETIWEEKGNGSAMLYRGMTPGERAAHITMRLLVHQESLTSRQVSQEYGVCRKAARDVLSRTSRVVPINCVGGVWQAERV